MFETTTLHRPRLEIGASAASLISLGFTAVALVNFFFPPEGGVSFFTQAVLSLAFIAQLTIFLAGVLMSVWLAAFGPGLKFTRFTGGIVLAAMIGLVMQYFALQYAVIDRASIP
jgi:hypothetical protein